MVSVDDIINILNNRFGVETSFENDNIGLLVGDRKAEVNGILCCLDATQSVIEQAKALDVNFIISHHPLLFTPFKALTSDSPISNNIISLIKSNINLYSAHTNLDFCLDGINDFCAQVLNLKNITPLIKNIGRVGSINEISLEKLKQNCMNIFNCNALTSSNLESKIKRVAIINGAGGGDSEYIDLCVDLGVDCLITSEIKHHVALYAKELNVSLIELSHFSMEYCFIPRLKYIITQELKDNLIENINVHIAKELNPIK